MTQNNDAHTMLVIFMLGGGVLGAIVGIVLAATSGTRGFIALGPAIGTTLGMSIGMALEARVKNNGG